jgi:hypothetical protein
MTNATLLFVLLCLGLPTRPAPSEVFQPDSVATLTVRAVSLNGLPLPVGNLRVTGGKGNVVFDGRIAGEVSFKLPYGTYNFSLTGDFIRPTERRVPVSHSNALVVLASEFHYHDDLDSTSISFHVHPSKSCSEGKPLWAKLVSVYSDDQLIEPISAPGYGLVEQVRHGTYVLVVVDSGTVRGTQVVKTSGPTTVVDMTLNECHQ